MASDEKTHVQFLKNGPIKVTHLEKLTNSRGEAIETKPTMALCRCGASQSKPFCDGRHNAIGFSDEKSDERVTDRLDERQGKKITILDNRGICSHAGFCTRELPEVWNHQDWGNPDAAAKDDIVGTIKKCPSGALSYAIEGKVYSNYHDKEPKIQVSRDGPYELQGDIEVDTEFGQGASTSHCVLCRCGASRNKPFCDGSHWYAGFRDDEALTISSANRAGESSGDSEWVAVGKSVEFDPGRIYSVTVKEVPIVLLRTDDGFRALHGKCPHQGGPLTEGSLCGGVLRCPWHGYDFSTKDGRGVGNDDKVQTFEVREQDGNVEIAAPKPKRSEWTVSHVMVETMVEWGLDTVFGMVGHSNLGLAEAIRIQEKRGKIRYFGVRHEGAAAFACSGYAKLTGRPAACLSIAGPGATNLLTGLWDAKVDRAPVLALTGQVSTQVFGPGAFQEIDLASAFQAVSRFSQTVLPNSKHAELASLALKNAIVERDVSHLIFPDEVQTIDAGREGPGRRDGRVAQTEIDPPNQALDYALYRIGRAKRPVVIVGHGAREGIGQVLSLAEALRCPVITTFKGKGLVSDRHPLGAGVLGRSGTPVASWFMNQADLLIVFGASFANHTGIATNKPIVQVDFDRMALGKFHAVDEAVWGDVRKTAVRLEAGLSPSPTRVDQRPELAARWEAWRKEKADRGLQDRGRGLNSAVIFERLSTAVPGDAVMSVDVGNNTYSFGRYFECDKQTVLMSGYLGSIGFALPAAMGAWAADTGRKVVSVSGDGGFGQYLGEFMTAVKYGMDITHVLINNNELGKISKEQRDGEWKVWQTGLHNADFSEYARLCGGHGVRVDTAMDLESAFKEALAVDGPSLVEIMADPLLW